MNRLIRVLLLGAVAVGILLALTAAPSSGGTRGQTGYGDDVLQPCKPGETASDGCLESLETEVAQAVGSATDDEGNTATYALYALGVLVIIGGVAFWLSRSDFANRFRRT